MGIKQGIKQGFEQGIEQGIEKGVERGVKNTQIKIGVTNFNWGHYFWGLIWGQF